MKVYIERNSQTKNLKAKNVSDLLNKLSLNPGTVLVIKNNALVTEQEKLKNTDEIRIISVVSGG